MGSRTIDVTVIIPTFGDRSVWGEYAERAARSVEKQTAACNLIQVHGFDLANARNKGAARAQTEWLIFLDADDELDPFYVEAMFKSHGDIRRPSTLGVVDGVEDDYPVMIPWGDIFQSNCIVIGAMMRRTDFLKSGGFDSSLPCLEDWDLFLKLYIAGALVTDVSKAIYRVHVRKDSRNQDTGRHGRAYAEIRRRYAAARGEHGGQR